MHEVEKILISKGGLITYEYFLEENAQTEDGEWYGTTHASAKQRAIAFVKTLEGS